MSEYSLTEPQKFEDCERYIVYIVKNGLLTGVAGEGSTPQKATEQAKMKIEAGEVGEAEMQFLDQQFCL